MRLVYFLHSFLQYTQEIKKDIKEVKKKDGERERVKLKFLTCYFHLLQTERERERVKLKFCLSFYFLNRWRERERERVKLKFLLCHLYFLYFLLLVFQFWKFESSLFYRIGIALLLKSFLNCNFILLLHHYNLSL